MTGPPAAPTWFSILRCPYCSGHFTFRESPRPSLGAAEFGILQCSCSEFPVLDGIPIVQKAHVGMFEHTTGATQVAGVAPATLVDLIKAGRSLDALLECLAVPVLPGKRWLPWRVSNSRHGRELARSFGKRHLRSGALARRQQLGLPELIDLFYSPSSPLGTEVGLYFLLRFGQPRHLAALALVAGLPRREKPVLDIACGLGHVEHYLTRRENGVPAIGTDMNFFHVWIARHWIAPEAHFVCANAEDGLPFAADSFSAIVCSDAYHYISNRRGLQKEIERCAPGQPVMLTRVGNAAVPLNEGRESSLDEYLQEFEAREVCTFSEHHLVRLYLQAINPFSEQMEEARTLRESKWFSFAWNVPRPSTPAAWANGNWPHAVGMLGINPIYRQHSSGGDDIKLRFDFRTPWYAYENHEMLSYHPQTATVQRSLLDLLRTSPDDSRVASLVASFVLIGLPERFHGSH
jgi:SAM-dependent methyltransferase